MKWINVLLHDIRRGIFRWRYLVVSIVFFLPCVSLFGIARRLQSNITWMDCMINLFKGIEPLVQDGKVSNIRIPIPWLLVVGSSLFISLDYLIGDLTKEGQNIIYRCRNRSGWYLSKCIWNITSSVVYFGVCCITVVLFIVLFKGDLALSNTPVLTQFTLNTENEIMLTKNDLLWAIIVAPLFTIISVNIIQMTLCLYIKPIYSFLICISILIISVYYPSSLVLGNGAMAIRSTMIVGKTVDTYNAIFVTMAIILLCQVLGVIRFKHFDILNLEE